jgi:hypothetical protein
VGCMLTAYSGFAALHQPGRRTSGLHIEQAVDYIVVAPGIDGPCQIRLDIVRLGLLRVIFGSHNGFVARTGLAAPAVDVCHSCCRRTGHHRRCRSLTVAAGPGLHSELAAGLHIVAEGRGHIYAVRFGGKTSWIGLSFEVCGVS